MINKNSVFCFIIVLLPFFLNSSIAKNDYSNSTYIKFGYKPTYVEKHKINDAKFITDDAKISINSYDPKYKFNFYGYSIGIGKYLGNRARSELELAVNLKFDIDKNISNFFSFGHYKDKNKGTYINNGFSFNLASFNLYYNLIPNISQFSSYIGGGIGLAYVDFMSDPSTHNITFPVALQFKSGFQLQETNIPIYIGYSLLLLQQKESENNIKANGVPKFKKMTSSYILHSAEIGLIFKQ